MFQIYNRACLLSRTGRLMDYASAPTVFFGHVEQAPQGSWVFWCDADSSFPLKLFEHSLGVAPRELLEIYEALELGLIDPADVADIAVVRHETADRLT